MCETGKAFQECVNKQEWCQKWRFNHQATASFLKTSALIEVMLKKENRTLYCLVCKADTIYTRPNKSTHTWTEFENRSFVLVNHVIAMYLQAPNGSKCFLYRGQERMSDPSSTGATQGRFFCITKK